MIKHGPVDVIVLAFGHPRFDGSVLDELCRQSEAGTIRVLDMMILLKDTENQGWQVEISDLSPEQAALLKFVEADMMGLFDDEDVAIFLEGMVPESAIVALAIEHTWTVKLVNEIDQAGGELAFAHRVPSTVVDEAFAALS